MKTQADDLRSEIKTLEVQLYHAALYNDAFSQLQLYKELQEKKSILDTLQWMQATLEPTTRIRVKIN